MRYKSLSPSLRAPARPILAATRRTPRRRAADAIATAVMLLCLPTSAALMTTATGAASDATSLSNDVRVSGAASSDPSSAVQWAGYEWRGRAPISVALDAHLTSSTYAVALADAARSWSASDVVDVVLGASGKRKIVVYQGEYGADVPAAWTQVSKRNGYVSSATIYLNDTKLAGASAWMLDFAICHEVGHGLGLGHQMDAVEPSCLSPMMPGAVPNAEDYAQLDLIYGR
jgi:hypothetical protein